MTMTPEQAKAEHERIVGMIRDAHHQQDAALAEVRRAQDALRAACPHDWEEAGDEFGGYRRCGLCGHYARASITRRAATAVIPGAVVGIFAWIDSWIRGERGHWPVPTGKRVRGTRPG